MMKEQIEKDFLMVYSKGNYKNAFEEILFLRNNL